MVEQPNGTEGKKNTPVQEMINDLNRRDKLAGLKAEERYFANSDLANLDWRTSPKWFSWLSGLLARIKPKPLSKPSKNI